MNKVRLGFVGVGGMGQAAHLRNYVLIPDVEVAAIAEIRPKLGQKVATRYGVPKVYNGHKELLAHEQLDGIVAIQPFGMHVNLVPELLEKGVPVLTEKPLAESEESGEKLYAAVKKMKGQLYLAYHKRSDPATTYAKKQMDDWIASGVVGKLRYLRVTMPPGDWIAGGFSQLIHTDEKYDGGFTNYNSSYIAFVNYYIHQVNLIRFLVGDYTIIAADPNGRTFTAITDNGVTIVLEMATFNTTLAWEESAFLGFEKGWIKLDLPAPVTINRAGSVSVYEDSGTDKPPTKTEPTMPWIHAMQQQAINFVKAIKGEKTVLTTAEDGLKDLKTATQYITVFNETKNKFPVK